MAGTGEDIVQALIGHQGRRTDFEWAWRQVAKVAAPDAPEFSIGGISGGNILGTGAHTQATAVRRSKGIYDSTAVWAVDRLASGIEALIVPQSEYWHGLDVLDLAKEEPTDDEALWLERTRNLLFKVRYDADSGWIAAVQTCLRRMVAFGNAFMLVEEGNSGHDTTNLIRYRQLPLNGCYADENHQGVIDTFYWLYQMTARQAVQKFAGMVPERIRKCAENPADSGKMFSFVHCIRPRSDFGSPSEGVKKTPWASFHVEMESKHIVRESGYFEFPIVDFRWLPEPGKIYGEGPVMKALADIQSLNLMAKNELIAGQQAIDPPLLIPHAGIMNRPNTNPGAVNMGGMTAAGQKLIEPLLTGQRLDFATAVLDAKREQVKNSLYLNLFQILVQNPQMTATEALLRANEKGELLGPAGTRLQQSLSGLIERELGILTRKGLYEKNSAYYPPRTLHDRDIGGHFTGPLSRMRKAKEAEATIQLLNILAPLAQVSQDVVDNMEPDETARGLADILGVPKKFIRKMDTVLQVRQQRADAQNAAQQTAAIKDLAAASKSGVDAISNLQNNGAF